MHKKLSANPKWTRSIAWICLVLFWLTTAAGCAWKKQYQYNYDNNGIQLEYNPSDWEMTETVVQGKQNARLLTHNRENARVYLMRYRNYYNGSSGLEQIVNEAAMEYPDRSLDRSTSSQASTDQYQFAEYNRSFQYSREGTDMDVKIAAKNVNTLLLIAVSEVESGASEEVKSQSELILDSAIFSTSAVLMPEDGNGSTLDESLEYDSRMIPAPEYHYLGIAYYTDSNGNQRDAYLPLGNQLEVGNGMISSSAHGIYLANTITPDDVTAQQIIQEATDSLILSIEAGGYTLLESSDIIVENNGLTAICYFVYQTDQPEPVTTIAYADIKEGGYLMAAITIDPNAADEYTDLLFEEIQKAYAFSLG